MIEPKRTPDTFSEQRRPMGRCRNYPGLAVKSTRLGGKKDRWFRSADKTNPTLVLLFGFSNLAQEVNL
jgi:hypothetical protein